MSEVRVRLYGPSGENDSWSRIARGMHLALERLGVSAGFFDLRQTILDDDDGLTLGYDAPIGIYVGPPKLLNIMQSRGRHADRLALIAANSSWMPPEVMEMGARYCSGWIGPSLWACNVLRQHGYGMPVFLWQHGVDTDAFRPPAEPTKRNPKAWRVLHLASTGMDRKGTGQLIEAWAECLWSGRIKNAQLDLVLSCPQGYAEAAIDRLDKGRYGGKGLAASVRVLPRVNFSETDMAALYSSYDLVCQPSRAEGFGLVPLEALACGVPVAATLCTGHDDFLRAGLPGVMPIRARDDKLSDDGPGAMAPEVVPEDIAWSLGKAYESRDWLRTYASRNAEHVRAEWSWEATTRRFLRNTGREVV